jgi:hypothetical protein
MVERSREVEKWRSGEVERWRGREREAREIGIPFQSLSFVHLSLFQLSHPSHLSLSLSLSQHSHNTHYAAVLS